MTSDRDASFTFGDEWRDTLNSQNDTLTPTIRPKLGGRFSRNVLRILNNWLAQHKQDPYPNDDDFHVLQSQTGLSRKQITNWFANTRRRGRMQCVRPASPQVRGSQTDPIDIIPRPGTPAVRHRTKFKGPLQRWVDSPPEEEGAAMRHIAQAIASGSGASSSCYNLRSPVSNDNDTWSSPYYMSSASSAGTSDSGSLSSHRSTRVSRRKRRRPRAEVSSVQAVEYTYQCTFCTETFKTKHDWQRHEKSLHLALEQWVCGSDCPLAGKPGTAGLSCTFCGRTSPDDAHMQMHNPLACSRRDIKERTFLRKDHLTQHLRLVHEAKYQEWSMQHWKIPKLDVRSRCGFCNTWMTSWGERIDHLAEHFKSGSTMAEWQGEWGFDDDVLKWVENSIPPYFIHLERQLPFPIKASDAFHGLPVDAYELIKSEMEIFTHDWYSRTGMMPTHDAMQLEACRIITACEHKAGEDFPTLTSTRGDSWLRDLIMSSEDLAREARSRPMELSCDGEISCLKIHGQHNLFAQCPLESQLRLFVEFERLMDVHVDDVHIQNEACEIIRRIEEDSLTPSESFASWITTLVRSSTDWLSRFKERIGISAKNATNDLASGPSLESRSNRNFLWLPPSSQSPSAFLPTAYGADSSVVDSVQADDIPDVPIPLADSAERQDLANYYPEDANFFRGFVPNLKRWVAATMCPQNPNCHIPSDAEIQHQARWLLYNGGDAWNQTPADFVEWLESFKRQVGIQG